MEEEREQWHLAVRKFLQDQVDAETLLTSANSMTWKGIWPLVKQRCTTCRKGVSRPKKVMQEIEAPLERNPFLLKCDILIRPA